jgi:excisionase family DNA binding protein
MVNKKMESMLTSAEAAAKLKVSTARVRQLILEGRLPAQKFGPNHQIREADLAKVKNRKHGRPKKK